ncbi:FHA domain-containing protein [Brevibacillus composti]|uniref:FHA domain-containing protein n=1 Tax=Brevibacillus composti TaxID=2796470 RepID=A0A7T5JPJ4_9BACL|nr:FHA domain-containing protein [Brevibacillus composti]QQE75523.1 FHA domain-containing protein [Brevibacillus composti]QUO42549.1 FHA domain-containing protein [Brevibacillus composti]
MEDSVYLLIQKGDPEQFQRRIFLTQNTYTIGRRGNRYEPDIAFSNPYVSRKHAEIWKQDKHFVISDLHSKHGTEVNDEAVSDDPRILRNGDRIRLAKGVAELVFFSQADELEATKEFTIPLAACADQQTDTDLVIHLERREIRLDNARFHLSGKDMDLLILLYSRANQAVSYEEIMVSVWKERSSVTDRNIPDVGRAEINALVYRLRKKLGRHGKRVTTIPRYGYMWEK